MKHHVLLVVEVPASDAEYAADILWTSGAQAIEERREGDSIRLLTDLGEHPLDRWMSIANSHNIPAEWRIATSSVLKAVADTWRDHAQPTSVAGIRIVPAWQPTTLEPTDVVIDPGGSFGMGDHPTTRATLELALDSQASSALDLGCGSGVLAIALAKFRGIRVVAVDIAPAAVEASLINAELNAVSELLVIEQGDIRCVRGTYDLVLANILAPVLLGDAADIALRVAPRGSVILSGFTPTREDDVELAYRQLGLRRVARREIDGWIALQMERVE